MVLLYQVILMFLSCQQECVFISQQLIVYSKQISIYVLVGTWTHWLKWKLWVWSAWHCNMHAICHHNGCLCQTKGHIRYLQICLLSHQPKIRSFLDMTSALAITYNAWLILPSPNSLSDIYKQETKCLWHVSSPFLLSCLWWREENNSADTDCVGIEIGGVLQFSFTEN